MTAAVRFAALRRQACFDELPDCLGAARDAARVAEIFDALKKLAMHRDDDALGGLIKLCNHAPNMHEATQAVNVQSMPLSPIVTFTSMVFCAIKRH
jgi:hypothetical protein